MFKQSGLSFLWLSFVAFIADLASKMVILQHFQLFDSVNIVPMFNLTYVQNHGAAFSFLADHDGWQKFLFIGLAIVISMGLLILLAKNKKVQVLQNSAYSLIIGGALGNMCDRLVHGSVVDFLDFYYQQWHYPIFNVADIAITCGAILLGIDVLKNSDKKKSGQE